MWGSIWALPLGEAVELGLVTGFVTQQNVSHGMRNMSEKPQLLKTVSAHLKILRIWSNILDGGGGGGDARFPKKCQAWHHLIRG